MRARQWACSLSRGFKLTGWRRVAARAIDTALCATPVWAIFGYAHHWYQANEPKPGAQTDDYALVIYVLAFIAGLAWTLVGWPLYEFLWTHLTRRTPGKWLLGLEVTDEAGAKVNGGSAFGRTALLALAGSVGVGLAFFLGWPYGIGWLALLVIPALFGQPTWIDLAAQTRVVRHARITAAASKAEQAWR